MTANLKSRVRCPRPHRTLTPPLRLRYLFGLAIVIMPALLVACQPGSLEPPRAATLTAQAALSATHTPEPLISSAPTATPGEPENEAAAIDPLSGGVGAKLTLWISDSGGAGIEGLEQGVADFTAESGIQVEIVRIAPRLLPELIHSAVISGTLPDLVLHPADYSHGWAEQGILDTTAATAVLESLGRGTFEPGALAQLTVDPDNGSIAALPSDGWQQLLLYRTDWFDELDLPPPTTYADLAAAAEAIHEVDSPISGIIVPTDSSLVSTQRVFEHLAIANGCQLANQDGEITLLHPACLEALEYYRTLINAYSPIGLQTDISALNGYLSGRTGIIIVSPAALPAIAGVSESVRPSCPKCGSAGFLSRNTGIVTRLQGDGESAAPANISAIMALGITNAADQQASKTFAEYWFDDLYPQWLAKNPEQKVPMRRGTAADETRYVDLWAGSPLAPGSATLADLYEPVTAALLSQDLATANRWGLAQGQGSLVTTLYEDLLFAPLLQDMLSGYFTSSQTIVEMYLSAVDAIPGYEFPIQVAPSPTP